MLNPKSQICRIAMWSGPRNISTAMMRSFESRTDSFVSDEPFYAHYLFETELKHPGYAEIIASQPTDWRKVVEHLTGSVPNGNRVWYQKQMTHHQLPGIGKDWMLNPEFQHAFLIRDPAEMLTSLFKILGDQINVTQTGYPQQVDIFRFVQQSEKPVIVADSKDILQHPERMLKKICEACQIPFESQMLDWPAGPRDTDGVWAPHWYDRVHQSTTFSKYLPKDEKVPEACADLLTECQTLYNELAKFKIEP